MKKKKKKKTETVKASVLFSVGTGVIMHIYIYGLIDISLFWVNNQIK